MTSNKVAALLKNIEVEVSEKKFNKRKVKAYALAKGESSLSPLGSYMGQRGLGWVQLPTVPTTNAMFGVSPLSLRRATTIYRGGAFARASL